MNPLMIVAIRATRRALHRQRRRVIHREPADGATTVETVATRPANQRWWERVRRWLAGHKRRGH